MSTPNKDIEKVEVRVKWDPSPHGAAANDLDIIAATYAADDPYGAPAYLVHFDSRSPDGTITLNRDSRTGQGFGFDEVMTIELNRLAERYGRVVVGVAIQQRDGHKTFGAIGSTAMEIAEGYTKLAENDFSDVAWATAAVVGSSPGTARALGLPAGRTRLRRRPRHVRRGDGKPGRRGLTTVSSGQPGVACRRGPAGGRSPSSTAGSVTPLCGSAHASASGQLQPLVEPQPSQM